ncbi:unnamed protein product [Hydatigera taeniaeformis]|uniref:Secreted protein n=1 Tax=Hydatigena taeniaeformis TaxID=6205 RepID=A0A0R3XB67_HYDTA|nr:unnamed protein product [Hydatigera taeniaeformis]
MVGLASFAASSAVSHSHPTFGALVMSRPQSRTGHSTCALRSIPRHHLAFCKCGGGNDGGGGGGGGGGSGL